MWRIYFVSLAFITSCQFAFAQPCELTTIASPQTITCGSSTELSAFGYGAGNIAFEEDFNSGAPVGWEFTQAVTIANNTCGVPSPDGTPFMWMGDASVNPRSMETVGFDLTLGGVICFEMRYAVQGQASPCEGPDLANEGVYVQYSTDNGATWNTIQYWNPNGGYDPQLTNWNQYCVTIPPGAQTGNTKIRWYQDDVSGAVYDHWGIDNVLITLNDPNFEISWQHDGYSYGMGQGGGVNPNAVSPTETTSYTAIITDGVETCTSTIEIIVLDPVMVVDAGENVSVCPGDCIELDGEAKVIVSPAKQPTYCDNTVEFIAGTPNIPPIPIINPTGSIGTINVDLDINITDLNMTNVLNGSITEVCINGFTLFNGSSLADLTVELSCPDGTTIVLVPQNTVTGQTYLNTCFVPANPAISSGSSPYSGTFNPQDSFDDLVGCSANGTWTLSISGTHTETFPPTGTLSGWCISFDDPEISYEADFTWSPTIDMTNETALNPTVCPNVETTYTLEATDANGCITVSDQVTVEMEVCCDLRITNIDVTPASCNADDGSITIDVTGEITGLVFSIDGGMTFQSSNFFDNLPAGNYDIVVTDDNDCDVFNNVTVGQNNPPVIDNINSNNPTCGNPDGSITITASNGTPGYEYSIDGVTFQSSNTFNNLSGGSYTVVVQDINGCEVSQIVTLTNQNGPTIDNVSTSNPSCGVNDGEISITVSGGTPSYTYSIDGVNYQVSNQFTNLGAGNYTISVLDNNGCPASNNVSLQNSTAPTIDNLTITDASCGSDDGEIEITASGGNGLLNYSIDNGTTNQTSNTFNSLAAGTYPIAVTDEDGCSAFLSVDVLSEEAPEITSLDIVNPDCDSPFGSISVNVTGGNAPYTFGLNDGTDDVIQPGNPLFNNLPTGNYVVVVVDANGCFDSESASIVNASPIQIAAVTSPISCYNACDGIAAVTVIGGQGIITYEWSNGNTTSSIVDVCEGTYTVSVTDEDGCRVDTTIVFVNPPSLDFEVTSQAETCFQSCDGTLSIDAQNGFLFSIDNGLTFSTVTNYDSLCPGNYTVWVIDQNDCAITETVIIPSGTIVQANFIVTPGITTILNTSFSTTNYSTNATSYNWTFDSFYSSNEYEPEIKFGEDEIEPGNYLLCLEAINENGCSNRTCQVVTIQDDILIYIPNTFTPDGNKFNDEFFPVISTSTELLDFEFLIFNRWGEIIFESRHPKAGWDGTYGGNVAPDGLYTWKLRVTWNNENKSDDKILYGHVNLLR